MIDGRRSDLRSTTASSASAVAGPLMLLMFVVGVGSLGWMFVLAVVMATEKNVSWGRKMSAPLGAVLLVWGATLLLLG